MRWAFASNIIAPQIEIQKSKRFDKVQRGNKKSRDGWQPLGFTFHYAWVVVAVTFLSIMVGAGVRSTPAVLIHPIERELGWSRATVSFAASLGLLFFGLSCPFVGQCIDRFGPRRVMLIGLCLTGGGVVVSAGISEVWQLDATWGVLTGIGTGAIASVLGVAVANRWFATGRGLVTGLFSAATSLAQLVFVPLLMWLVVTVGWRWAVASLGGVVLLLLVPVLALMRDDPAEVGLQPRRGQTSSPAGIPSPDTVGQALGEAIRAPAFWLLIATYVVCGATDIGLMGTHLVPHAIELGIPEVMAAGTVALMGATDFVGALLSGFLADRVDPRRLLATYFGLRALWLFWLPWLGDFTGLSVFAVLYGLGFTGTIAPMAVLTGDLFGRRRVGVIFGWLVVAHQLGAAAAAYLAGVAHASLGDYHLSFLGGGGVALIGAFLVLCVRRAASAPAKLERVAEDR